MDDSKHTQMIESLLEVTDPGRWFRAGVADAIRNLLNEREALRTSEAHLRERLAVREDERARQARIDATVLALLNTTPNSFGANAVAAHGRSLQAIYKVANQIEEGREIYIKARALALRETEKP